MTPPPYQPPYQPPTGPPTAPVPPVGGWTVPPPQTPGLPPPVPQQTEGSPRRSRGWIIVAVVVLIALVIGGTAGAFVMLTGFGRLEVSVDTCEISADGTLTATGTVDGPSGTGVEVAIQFVDIDTGEVVDSDATSLDLGTAIGADPWSLTGSAGDEVDQVTCNVTAIS